MKSRLGLEYFGKAKFIDGIAKETGFAKKDIKIIVDAFYSIINKNCEDAIDMDLGVFYVTNFLKKGGYETKNILTNQMVIVPDRRIIRMKMKPKYKDKIKRTNIDKIQSSKIEKDDGNDNK